jgi:hypothetical protein
MDARKAEDLDHPVVANVDIRVGNQTFTINNIKLAPSCAVVAMNVCFIDALFNLADSVHLGTPIEETSHIAGLSS